MEGGQPTPRSRSMPRRYPMPQCSKPNQPSSAAGTGKLLPNVNCHAGGKATRGESGETTHRGEPHACETFCRRDEPGPTRKPRDWIKPRICLVRERKGRS